MPLSTSDSLHRWLSLIRLVGFILLLFFFLDAVLTAVHGTKGDLEVFIHAAQLMLRGEHFYDFPNRLGIFYLYPPLFALLCIPLTFLPINVTAVLWACATMALIGWSMLSLYKGMAGQSLFAISTVKRWLIVGGTFLMVVRFIHSHLVLSQANVFILAAAAAVILLAMRQRPAGAGLLLGIAAMIKLFVYPLGVFFLTRKNSHVIVWAVVGMVIAVLIPSAILGFDRNLFMHQEWLETVILKRGPASDSWINTFNLSLQAQFYRFLSDRPAFYFETSRYFLTIWNAPEQLVAVLNWAALISIPAAVAAFTIKFRNHPELISTWGSIACTFSLVPLSSPIAQAHHFVLLIPSCLYVMHLWIHHRLYDRWFLSFIAAFFVLTQLTTEWIWGTFFSELFIASGLVTYGTLFLTASIVRAAFVLQQDQASSSSRPT